MQNNIQWLFINIAIYPLIASFIIYFIAKIGLKKIDNIPNDGLEKLKLSILILPSILAFIFILMPTKFRLPEFKMGQNFQGKIIDFVAPLAQKSIENQSIINSKIDFSEITNIIIYLLISVYFLISLIGFIKFAISKFEIRKIYKNCILSDDFNNDVLISENEICAFIHNGKIIISKSLVSQLSRHQIELVLSHERAHLLRNDALYYDFLSIIEILFWFNPIIKNQTIKCRFIAEVTCDEIAINKTKACKNDYADTIIKSLQVFHNDIPETAPAVISNSNIRELKMRLSNIMQSDISTKKISRLLPLGIILSLLPIGAAQFALAQSSLHKEIDISKPIPPEAHEYALLTGKITAIDKNKFHTEIAVDGKSKEVDSWAVSIDYGSGILGEYSSLIAPKLQIGDTISKGKDLGDLRLNSLTIQMENCFKELSCAMNGHAGRTFPSGDNVMWGNVTFHKNGYDIHADIMFSNDKSNKQIVAQDNVSIVENPNFIIPKGL